MKHKMLVLAVVLGTFHACTGCAALKPVARTVVDIARCLCEKVMSENPGELANLSVEEYCAKEELLRPFVDEMLAAEKRAKSRAGVDGN